MRRLALVLGLLASAGAGLYLALPSAETPPEILTRRARLDSSAVFELLPGGPFTSQIAAGTLSGSRGETVTFTRASSAVCENASGGLTTLSANLPRVEATGFRVEGGATNLLLRSEEFDSASWGKANASATANTTAAPDGTTTADTITSTTASGDARQDVTAGGATAHVFSLWIRADAAQAGQLVIYNVTTATNLVQEAISITTAWQRLSVVASSGVAAGNTLRVRIVPFASGSGGSAYVWGAQLETGSTATSYISTTGTSASRSAEVATVSTAGWPTTAGSVEVTYTPTLSTHSGQVLFDSRATASTSGLLIYFVGADIRAYAFAAAAGASAWSGGVTWTAGQSYRIRATWSGTTLSLYRDDVLLATGSGAVPNGHGANAYIGSDFTGGGQCRGNLHSLSVRK